MAQTGKIQRLILKSGFTTTDKIIDHEEELISIANDLAFYRLNTCKHQDAMTRLEEYKNGSKCGRHSDEIDYA